MSTHLQGSLGNTLWHYNDTTWWLVDPSWWLRLQTSKELIFDKGPDALSPGIQDFQ